MTWEWLVIIAATYFVVHAIGAVEHHVKQSAESLVQIAVTLEAIENRIAGFEEDLSKIRRQVAPTPMPWDEPST